MQTCKHISSTKVPARCLCLSVWTDGSGHACDSSNGSGSYWNAGSRCSKGAMKYMDLGGLLEPWDKQDWKVKVCSFSWCFLAVVGPSELLFPLDHHESKKECMKFLGATSLEIFREHAADHGELQSFISESLISLSAWQARSPATRLSVPSFKMIIKMRQQRRNNILGCWVH